MTASPAALDTLRARLLASLPCNPLDGRSRIAIWGAGFLGRWAVPWLRGQGASVVGCFDTDPAKAGTQIEGVPVLSPEAIDALAPDLVFITARHAVGPVSARLAQAGRPAVSLDAFCAARDFSALMDIHDRTLADDRSRETLRAVLETMLTGDSRPCAAVFDREQYFCLPAFCGAEPETYVDAGAYVGDSLERFIWAQNGFFDRVYAFEPGARQFEALETRTRRLRAEWALGPDAVTLVQAGLSDRAGHVSAETGNGVLQSVALSAVAAGGVPTVSLDAFLAGGRVTFVKADVEGMETALLDGASETIRRWRPKLAICVYHYPTDIPAITRQIEAMAPGYTFALRHHSPRFLETVLYGWPA